MSKSITRSSSKIRENDEKIDKQPVYIEVEGFKIKLNENETENENENDIENENENEEENNIENVVPNSSAILKVEQQKKVSKTLNDLKDFTNNTANVLRDELNEPQKPRLKKKSQLIVELSGRKVHLSDFDLSTPLYPLCRAWITQKREPSRINFDYLFSKLVKRPDNGLQVLDAIQKDEISAICVMPVSLPLQMVSENARERIPTRQQLGYHSEPNLQAVEEILRNSSSDTNSTGEENESMEPGQEVLLTEHMKRWKRVRSIWKIHIRNYDRENYGVNHTILETMFKMQMDIDNERAKSVLGQFS